MRVVSRVPHKKLDMVDAIAIIKLLNRLADPDRSEVLLAIDIPSHTIEMGIPPHAQLELVVPVEGTGVENVGLSRLAVGPDVAVPKIPVQETWFDGPAI